VAAARASQASRASSKSTPVAMTVAPSWRIAATLTGFAPSGTKTVAGAPNSWAAKATDWPWLPVEAASTPRARVAGSSWASRLTPPRTLKLPVGRWFSCLTETSVPTSAESPGAGCSGVTRR